MYTAASQAADECGISVYEYLNERIVEVASARGLQDYGMGLLQIFTSRRAHSSNVCFAVKPGGALRVLTSYLYTPKQGGLLTITWGGGDFYGRG